MKNSLLSIFVIIMSSIVVTGCIPNQPQNTQDTQITQTGQAGEASQLNDAQPAEQSQTLGRNYVTYSPDAVAQAAATGRAVLYFYATWCPTCKVANQEFLDRGQDIPDDVTIIRTDYDTYDQLKEDYGVTYQHTFVQVDAAGNMITKWNGGGVDELVSRIQ